MGTAVMADVRAIEAAKQEAVRLLGLAYQPQPVPQPDGTTLHLCLAGRIARACDKLAAARRAGDVAAARKIEAAYTALRSQYNAATEAAERAASAWAALATAQGVTVDPVSIYPPPCRCEACVAQQAHMSHQSARDVYTNALYEAIAPNSAMTPPLVDLVRRVKAGDKDANRQLWAHLGRIADTSDAYLAACADAQVSPNWRLALYPGGEE